MAKSSGTSGNILSLPKGGGAAKPIDESFKTDLSTGSGFYQVPIQVPKGVGEMSPSLALSYGSGNGNGPFGMGWSMVIPSILRSTKNSVPSFDDNEDTLTFDSRELIAVGGDIYQPEVEIEFNRIKKLAQGWEVKTKTGLTMLLGVSDNSRQNVMIGGQEKILKWSLEELRDANGNSIHYHYTKDGGQLYLEKVTYSIYEILFSYQNRQDPIVDYRYGFEIQTNLICSAIDVNRVTPAVDPIKSYRFTYHSEQYSKLSQLMGMKLVALNLENNVVEEIELPGFKFGYSEFQPLSKKLEVFDNSQVPPPSLLSEDATLMDFEGTGIPGVIEIKNGSARFWKNRGDMTWSNPIIIKETPLHSDLSNDMLRFADMNASSSPDLFLSGQQMSGFFPLIPNKGWGRKVSYKQSPNVSIADSNVRLLDINGDNKTDLLYADSSAFYHYINNGEDWDPQPIVTKRKRDHLQWPDVSLADPSVRLSNIVGDGRSHIVQIFDRNVFYWPNLGNGKWGTRKRIANAPKLPRNYNPKRLFLADINGTGMADIIYVDYDRVQYWINQSGQSFSDPIEIVGTPQIAHSAILIADMKGTGTNGILWSYHDGLRRTESYRYIDMCGGKKPFLLNRIENNTKVVTEISYGSSTEFDFSTDDSKLTEETFLPFPVNVVKKMKMSDTSTGVVSESLFKYYAGNYDPTYRRFLGFGKAERIDVGDATAPSNLSVSYFHNNNIFLKGKAFFSATFSLNGTALEEKPMVTEESVYSINTLKQLPQGKSIVSVYLEQISTKDYEQTDLYNEVKKTCKYDNYGNKVEETQLSTWRDSSGTPQERFVKALVNYTQNIADWLVGLPIREATLDKNGVVLNGKLTFYDGPAFTGLPLGQVTKGNMTRERLLALTAAQIQQVYGTNQPDWQALKYYSDNDPILGSGQFIDRVAQKFAGNGNPIERKNALGHLTTIEFDAYGIYPTKVTSPKNIALQATYEYKYGSIISYLDANLVEQKFEYDKVGRLVKNYRHDDPPGKPFMEFQYFPEAAISHNITLTRTEKGANIQHKRVEYFDGLGNTLQLRSEGDGGSINVNGNKEYNAKGLIVKEYQPYKSNSIDYSVADQVNPDISTMYTFDARGRSLTRRNWEGELYTTTYNLSSKVHHDPLDLLDKPGNDAFNTPKIEWLDAEGYVTEIIEQKKNAALKTDYTYDCIGQRTQVQINNSTLLENSFDCLGRRIMSVYRDAGTNTYTYDANSNLIELKDGKSDIVFRKYDELSRMTELRYGGPAGTLQEKYTYDTAVPASVNTKGKLVKVSGPFGNIKYQYSKCGCILSKTRKFTGLAGELTVAYESDSLQRFTKIVYPDGHAVDIKYNHGGLIDSISGVIDKIHYDATFRRERIEYSNNVVTEYEYDPHSFKLTKTKTTAPDGVTTYQDLEFGYNQVGNASHINDAANVAGHIQNNRSFEYDELYQLLEAQGTDLNGAYNHKYSYDILGNLTRNPEHHGTNDILRGDANKPFQVTGIDNVGNDLYKYDAVGNIIKTPGNSFEYDARNRLIKTTNDQGVEKSFFYDQHGSRVITRVKANGQVKKTFNFDDIYFVSDTQKTKVIYDEGSQLAYIDENGQGAIFHKDHLGSHEAESALNDGAYLGQESYYAFGGVAFDNINSGTTYQYNGKKYSSIPKICYFGGRYYLPELGVFLTADPYFLEQQPDKFFDLPSSLQLYGYVQNNPINIIDPNGLWFGLDDLIVAAVGFVVGVAAYLINAAISGTSVNFGEMLMAGIMGAATGWLVYNTLGIGAALIVGAAMLAAPAITGGLDQAAMGDSFGARFAGFLSFCIKFAASPTTSSVGLLIGGFGTGFGLWGDVEWFKGGVIAFEYNPTGNFSAVTLGATVNIWSGNTKHPLFEHELYHSRQYTYFSDAFIPLWIVGGLYGLLSSAIAGNPQGSCFFSTNPNAAYGNPLEDGAHQVERGKGCA